jgi:hypothetical protein
MLKSPAGLTASLTLRRLNSQGSHSSAGSYGSHLSAHNSRHSLASGVGQEEPHHLAPNSQLSVNTAVPAARPEVGYLNSS